MCWQAQVRCQRSRTASETFGAVGEVHPLEAWTRHQRSSRSIGEAAAATEEHRLEASARPPAKPPWMILSVMDDYFILSDEKHFQPQVFINTNITLCSHHKRRLFSNVLGDATSSRSDA
jgi:hypothetical protein